MDYGKSIAYLSDAVQHSQQIWSYNSFQGFTKFTNLFLRLFKIMT